MCGILGSIPAIGQERFELALSRLKHRGPDAIGSWHHNEAKLSLGATRLSIYDPNPRSNQPFSYGPLRLIFNGAIYNHSSLRTTLEQLGHAFRTSSDTEVVAAALLQWGTSAFRKFNGMWAMAIWDERNEQLTLSRDRFGQKPLLWAKEDERFFFGSEMKAIAGLMNRIEINHSYDTGFDAVFEHSATAATLLNGINNFPAAHFGILTENGLKLHRYWETIEELDLEERSDEQWIEEFKELLQDSIRLRLIADVPLATSLSGGVDSSSVLAAAKMQHPSIQAISTVFSDTLFDEREDAMRTAEALKVPLELLQIDPSKLLGGIADDVYLFENPYLTACSPLIANYRAIRSNGIKVSLDGHGADELFCGYGKFFFKRFADLPFLSKQRHGILTAYNALNPKGHEQQEAHQAGDWQYLKSYLYHKTHEEQPRLSDPSSVQNELKALGCFGQGLYRIFHQSVLPTLLRNYDLYSMAAGVEVRMPFLDHRLVSKAFSMPAHLKVADGKTKLALRKSVSDWFPSDYELKTKKVGFQSPILDWARGSWREMILDETRSTSFGNSSLIDRKNVRGNMLELTGDRPMSYQVAERLWSTFEPYLWEKYFYNRLIERSN